MKTAALSRWIKTHTGLEAEKLGLAQISRFARERLVANGGAVDGDYLGLLQQSPDESARFLDRIVVSETWFFRERAAIDELIRHVTTTWARQSPGQTLRVLSVPCASGEEPYSLAMALAQTAWPVRRLHIDAYDLSEENIRRARLGLYRASSFRSADLMFRDYFFEAVGTEWRLRPGLRLPVHFASGNVLAADFASASAPYDVIFCRNLLIYFDEQTQWRVIHSLLRRLKPDGILVLGSAEAALAGDFGLQAVDGARALLQRRAAAKSLSRPRDGAVPRSAAPRTSPPFSRHPATRNGSLDPVARLRELANQGRLHEAAHFGQSLLRDHSQSADLQCLLAILAEAGGCENRAESHYRKALYLDPGHHEALSHFALLLERRGQTGAAEALRRRAPGAHLTAPR
jgi:chemotaxis protein methyltransferase WspC